MLIKVDKFMYNLRDEIKAHGIYMATRHFPWADTFEFYQRVSNLKDYESSFPYYQEHQDKIHKHLNDIAESLGWTERLSTFLYVKQNNKGFHLPSRNATIIFSLDSDVKCLTAKSGMTLLNCLAVYDYDLFDFSGRKITRTTIKKGSGKIVGNTWHHCLHLEEGQEIFYATYS